MGEAISEVLPFAIGVAIVPIPIIAVILMLFSSRARVNGPVFVLGWVVGLSVAFVVVFLLADAGDPATDETAESTLAWGKLVLGAGLLLLAVRTWRKRPAPGTDAPTPRWMRGVDSFTAIRAFGLAVALAAVNPKNLILVVGAAAGVAEIGVSGGDALAALLAFVLVGSLSVAIPVGYYLVGGERATSTLEELKVWLGTHNEAIMAVLFLVFGVILVSQGLAPLTE
jgi:hypothetical protein